MRGNMFYRTFMIFVVACFAGTAWSDFRVELPEHPTPAEQTAARELRHYLERSIKDIVVAGHDEVVFHIGDTPLAQQSGLDSSKLEDEAWRIRNIGGDVVISGGGTRGPLYAVSHFLEDVVGVRFLTTWEEYVPKDVSLRLESLDLGGKPFFIQRDQYRSNVLSDNGRFPLLRRMNRDGDNYISGAYGGSFNYGSPYFAHTCDRIIPASEYLESHPEYFSLRNGKRVGGKMTGQLCLSNPEMRNFFLQRLLEFIRQDEAKARAAGINPPAIYDVSINDNWSFCQCDACTALAERTGGQTGVLVDFLNEISDGVRAVRPDIYISTLAYFYTEEPSKNTPRDNIIFRLCDTRTNQAQPFSRQSDRNFIDRLQAWSKIANVLGIWDYAITYRATGFPYPHEYTLKENLQTYANNKVKFMFYEHEKPEIADMFELCVYLETRLFEDPFADFEMLRRDFLEKYYGAAAPFIDAYRQEVKRAADEHGNFIDWFAEMPSHFSHMDTATVVKSQQLFDQAEAAVADDAELLRRVRRARLNLDRITYAGDGYLAREWKAAGKGEWPFDKTQLIARARKNWQHSIDDLLSKSLPTTQGARKGMEETMNRELDFYAALPRIPAMEWRDMPWRSDAVIFDTPVDMVRLCRPTVSVVADPEAAGGYAIKAVPSDGKSILPVTSGLGCRRTFGRRAEAEIDREKIPGPGYHWYKIADIRLEPTMYAYYLDGRQFMMSLALASERYPNAPAELWVHCKFTGSDVPGGKPGEEEAFWLDHQVVVIR